MRTSAKTKPARRLDIVHRDVSPQNILLSYDGAVKIADFGIASANLFREEPGVLKGKTAYMSPEQARGERVTRRTDIYSLGVVFHELLSGRALHGEAEGARFAGSRTRRTSRAAQHVRARACRQSSKRS
ncbi:MAG: protein kinase [Polyangiaceae bacterium]